MKNKILKRPLRKEKKIQIFSNKTKKLKIFLKIMCKNGYLLIKKIRQISRI